ncbi:MAG: peptide chain release factor N(5)-glutamine methyltransferase [Chthoniobacterales bacterium]
MTVLEVIQSATTYLEKHGVPKPRLNAEHLLAQALGKRRLDLYLEFDRPLSDAERAPLRKSVRERSEGKPLQYLLGEWDFFGRTFHCDARALIPRPETEQLIELTLPHLSNIYQDLKKSKSSTDAQPQPLRIADIGTGSGVIAITLAEELAEKQIPAQITATDLSEEALSLAKENARLHPNSEKIQFIKTSLFPDQPTSFHAILANLPYIPTAELAHLQRELDYEPRQALDGGADGLDFIRPLIEIAAPRLEPNALLALEFSTGQENEIETLCKKSGLAVTHFEKDHQALTRFAIIRKQL